MTQPVSPVTGSLLTRVKSRLYLRSRRKATHLLDGHYASIHRGRSLDFDDLREYVPGDAVADIDWKASARAQTTLIRRWADERRHRVMFIVDTGRNMAAHSLGGDLKRDIAVTVTGTLGYLAVRHGDEVGLIAGDSSTVRARPFRSSEAALERMLRDIHDDSSLQSPVSSTEALLDRARATLRHRSLVVVVTDEIDLSERLEAQIVALSAQHELVWVEVLDADPTAMVQGQGRVFDVDGEWQMPSMLRDNSRLRREFAEQYATRRERMRELLEHRGVSVARIGRHEDAVPQLLRALKARQHARR
ncbi:DUF58 domain-containing protein [Gulosibacter molinativorax]|uniref:DUF58 domain-containing protein n=1 Tax=Gulosibacter molinativorax TaxID=256821 RepID=UPI0006880B80|nr:DUF58 domain-containing protein [Gulosibacter molinativorax]QUY61824.1 Putative lipoprotein [Gulosibacter molinativorax]